MCGIQDAIANIMPVDWLEPYGRTPFAKDAEMSVDITIVETDDGIRATSVKNPPTSGSTRLIDAIKTALGMGCMEIGPENGSQQAADLGKCKTDDKRESQNKSKESQDSDMIEDAAAGKEEDAKEKAPKF